MATEPAFGFFVNYLEAEGAAVEADGEVVLAVLPEELQRRHGFREELVLSADPDVAAEHGALLCIPGQPVLLGAADEVLARGDVGWAHLPWPLSAPPTRERLEQAAREELMVDHGRIDLSGPPSSRWLPLLSCGALVGYRVGLEERVEEKAEVLVDAHGHGRIPDGGAAALSGMIAQPGRGAGHEHLQARLLSGVARAQASLSQATTARRDTLRREAARVARAERQRVEHYYASVLASIARRARTASEDRRALYDAQVAATEAERARRVAEVEEKFAATCEIRPYRLRVLEVPALAVPAAVRRGARVFHLPLLYCLPLSRYLLPNCPHCGADEPLVAGKDRLGCRACLLRPVEIAPAGPPDAGRLPAAERPAPVTPAAVTPARRQSAEARGTEAEPSPAVTATDAEGEEKRARARRRRVDKAWRDVAMRFWQHVALGERVPEVAAHSPLSAVQRWYGARGALVAVGCAPSSELRSFSAEAPDEDEEGVFSTSGVLSVGGESCTFTLRWRLVGTGASLVEVLPYRFVRGAALPRALLLGAGVRSRLHERAPVPRGLGPVGQALFARAAEEGLPLLLRCLALHGRIEGSRHLADVPPTHLAAALLVEARRHSGVRPTPIADLAAATGCSNGELRLLAERVSELAGSRATRPW